MTTTATARPEPRPDAIAEYRRALGALEAAAAQVEELARPLPPGRPLRLKEAHEWVDDMERALQPLRPGDTLVLQGARAGARVVLERVDRRWVYDTSGQRYCRTTGMQRYLPSSKLSEVDRGRVRRDFGAGGTPR